MIYNIVREVWGNEKKVHFSPVMLLRKNMVKTIIFGDRLTHTEKIFLNLNILPIAKLVQT